MRPSSALASREERRWLLEVPAEVDLGPGDLVLVVEGEDLRIPASAAGGGVGFVRDDHRVAGLDQPDDLEVLASASAGPATLEVAVTVEPRVRRGGEEEVVAQALLEKAPVAGCKRGIGIANDLFAVGHRQRLYWGASRRGCGSQSRRSV